jgi:ubiquinone/menaquinone biosynthesis C-methylase UbiE
MEFTGERMVPEYNAGKQIYAEHMSRYLFATQFTVDKEVLDIACGSGYGSHLLLVEGKSKTIVGVDIAKETVDYCKEKYKSEKLSFVVGSCEEIPLPDKSFDVVVSFETIEHINNHAGFLKEIKRVLRANGILVMSTPNADISQKENHFHVHEINVGEFDNMLMKHFKHLKLFYQDIGLGSYICGSEHNNFKA